MKTAAMLQKSLRKVLALFAFVDIVVFAKHFRPSVDSFGMQVVSCSAPAIHYLTGVYSEIQYPISTRRPQVSKAKSKKVIRILQAGLE
jgi:hypothetical protein